MNTIESNEQFKLSKYLVNQQRYAEALAILDKLGDKFPYAEDEVYEDILFLRALCLYNLGRYAETKHVCNALLKTHSAARAEDLLIEIAEMEPQSSAVMSPAEPPSSRLPYPVDKRKARIANALYILVGTALLIHTGIALIAATHDPASSAVPHLLASSLAVVCLYLDAARRYRWAFPVVVVCVLALLPTWFFALDFWPHGDDVSGFVWLCPVGPLALINTVISFPIIFVARSMRGDP